MIITRFLALIIITSLGWAEDAHPLLAKLTDANYQTRSSATADAVRSFPQKRGELTKLLLDGMQSRDPELAHRCTLALRAVHDRYVLGNFPARLPIRRGRWLFHQHGKYENYVRVRELKVSEEATELREGDVIVKVNGRLIDRNRPFISLNEQLANRNVGDTVELAIRRATKDRRADRPKRDFFNISVELVPTPAPEEDDEPSPAEKEKSFQLWINSLREFSGA